MATMVILILKACVPLNGMADWNVDKRDSQVYTRHSDYNVLNEPGACACHRLGSPGKGHIHSGLQHPFLVGGPWQAARPLGASVLHLEGGDNDGTHRKDKALRAGSRP